MYGFCWIFSVHFAILQTQRQPLSWCRFQVFQTANWRIQTAQKLMAFLGPIWSLVVQRSIEGQKFQPVSNHHWYSLSCSALYESLSLSKVGGDLHPQANKNLATEIPKHYMSNVQNPCDIPLYWLVNRDPYSGLIYIYIYHGPAKPRKIKVLAT